MSSEINFEKYLGKSYEEFFDDLYELVENGVSKSTKMEFSVSINGCDAVDRDYQMKICDIIGDVLDNGYSKTTSVKDLLDYLFTNWINELIRVNDKFSTPRSMNQLGTKPLSDSAEKVAEGLRKKCGRYSFGNRKRLSVIDFCYHDNKLYLNDDISWIKPDEDYIIELFIKCTKYYLDNFKTKVYCKRPASKEEYDVIRRSNIEKNISMLSLICNSVEDYDYAISLINKYKGNL